MYKYFEVILVDPAHKAIRKVRPAASWPAAGAHLCAAGLACMMFYDEMRLGSAVRQLGGRSQLQRQQASRGWQPATRQQRLASGVGSLQAGSCAAVAVQLVWRRLRQGHGSTAALQDSTLSERRAGSSWAHHLRGGSRLAVASRRMVSWTAGTRRPPAAPFFSPALPPSLTHAPLPPHPSPPPAGRARQLDLQPRAQAPRAARPDLGRQEVPRPAGQGPPAHQGAPQPPRCLAQEQQHQPAPLPLSGRHGWAAAAAAPPAAAAPRLGRAPAWAPVGGAAAAAA